MSRTLIIFYLLVAYVVVQLAWWAWLLADLNREIYLLKNELNLHVTSSPSEAMEKGNELLSQLHKKWMMILGEGLVFFVLLTAGIFITRKSILKEKALADQQRNFLLSITHELRTPIASLKLQLETIQKRELDEEKKKTLLLSCLHDTDRLNSLVENILTATAIDQKQFSLHRDPGDLSAFITQTLERSLAVLRPEQKIEQKIQPGLQYRFDAIAMPSILHNLLENAIKYSSPESTITVSLAAANKNIELSVSDTGNGIPDAEKTKIFERFYRSGSEQTRKTKGTGLGLFIAKFLTEKHGGVISVRDNSPTGSIFTVRFQA